MEYLVYDNESNVTDIFLIVSEFWFIKIFKYAGISISFICQLLSYSDLP